MSKQPDGQFHGKIHTVRREATRFADHEPGILTIYNRPHFNVGTRDLVFAEYCTTDGEFGQVCTDLRASGPDRYYVRGPHAVPTGTPRHQILCRSIEAAVSAALDRAAHTDH